MQLLGKALAFLFAPLASLTAIATPMLAALAHRPPAGGDFALAAFLVSSGLVTIFCGLWAASQRVLYVQFRRQCKTEAARAYGAQLFREALIGAAGQPIVVMGVDMNAPLGFAGGHEVLKSCLGGPDAAKLAMALDTLLAKGTGFEFNAMTSAHRVMMVRGVSVGGRVAVFFREERNLEGSEADGRAVLDSLSIPIWVRNKDLALRWVNQAFLDATGNATIERAIQSNVAFDRTELELAATARDDDAPVVAKRYAMVAGQRRALALTLQPLDDVGVAGSAVDVTDVAQAEIKLQTHIEGLNDILDNFETAVVAFDSKHMLVTFNTAFATLFDLPEKWLRGHPTDSDIFDRLREERHLPEQRDFAAWKRLQSELFDTIDGTSEELWHLPSGMSVRVLAERNAFGGITFRFEDVSDRLKLESTCNTLRQVQKATLDTLDDGVAIVGTDGRVKVYNGAFSKLWHLKDEELLTQPHIRNIAELCAERIGRDQTWEIVAAGVAASEPHRLNDWGKVGRADGKVISLTMSRLPDGSTLASFVDLSEAIRFEMELQGHQNAA